MLLVAALAMGTLNAGCAKHTAIPIKVELGAKRQVLPNGLEVVILEDHRSPTVSVRVRYHSGSKDDPATAQGLAHFVEHLTYVQTAHIKRDEVFPLMRKANAERENGETTYDATEYYETVPVRHFERALFIERERMGFALEGLDEPTFEREKAVVLNEWRQNYETESYGLVRSAAYAAAFPEGHPYHFRTIGDAAQLKAATLDGARAFYKENYAPNNATLVIVGDIDPTATRALVEKYFGDLVAAAPKAQKAVHFDQAIPGRTIKMEANVEKPELLILFRFPPHGDPAWYETVHALSRIRSTILGLRHYFENDEPGATNLVIKGGRLGYVGGLEMVGSKKQTPAELRSDFEHALTQYRSFANRSSDVDLRSRYIIDSVAGLERSDARAQTVLGLLEMYDDPNAVQRDLKGWMGVDFTEARDNAGDRFDLAHAIQVEVVPNKSAPTAGKIVGESK